ncbi:hypothetical protein VZO05_11935 [Aggregatilineales bacterium SYSU G02658]
MPTPFTHLAYAQRMLDSADSCLLMLNPAVERPAFLLGSVAADARVPALDSRAATHFYTYTEPMRDHPWRVMLAQNPYLDHPTDPALAAFVAGYVFHLAMDEYWSREMLGPHFAHGTWGSSRAERFYVLHLLLIAMDERDERTLPPHVAAELERCQPNHWLGFMSDDILSDWRDFIARQITGQSETLRIFGERIGRSPQELRQVLDSAEQMHHLLYQHLTPSFLADFEQHMYDFACEQLAVFARQGSR